MWLVLEPLLWHTVDTSCDRRALFIGFHWRPFLGLVVVDRAPQLPSEVVGGGGNDVFLYLVLLDVDRHAKLYDIEFRSWIEAQVS